MARPSKYDHLKPKIRALLDQGSRPAAIAAQFPDVPVNSIKTLTRAIKASAPIEPAEKKGLNPGLNPPPPVAAPPADEWDEDEPDAGPKLTVLPSGSDSDYQLIRRTMRTLLRSRNKPEYVQIGAARVLAKLIEMRAELPAHVLNETDESDLDAERAALRKELSPAEMVREYRELLG
ncbi:MAG TPA: hypothetical protein V6D06_05225 [Trichocoleus sp.]